MISLVFDDKIKKENRYLVVLQHIDKMKENDHCDVHGTSYKRTKTFEECKEIALFNSSLLSKEIEERREVSWNRVLKVSNSDELIYKLTLKYLRQKGYDIGNNKNPSIHGIVKD